MGYRLDAYLANDESKWACFGKFYGYVDDWKLSSYRYLVEIGKIAEKTIFGYGHYPKIVLSAEEFEKFVFLYLDDWEKVYKETFLLSYRCWKRIDDLMKDKGNKVLDWG